MSLNLFIKKLPTNNTTKTKQQGECPVVYLNCSLLEVELLHQTIEPSNAFLLQIVHVGLTIGNHLE